MQRPLAETGEPSPFAGTLLAAPWKALERWIHRHDPVRERGLREALVRTVRIAYLVVRDFLEDTVLVRAAALTYVTVLSIVPVLAVAFALAKGFGAYERLRESVIKPFLDNIWGRAGSAPAGIEQLRSLVERILQYVDETNFGALGTLGLVTLLWTVISLLSSVEKSFNKIWNVARPRTLVRKVTDYLAIVVVTPIFLLTATAIGTAWSSAFMSAPDAETTTSPFIPWVKDSALADVLLPLMPVFTMWALLTFVYMTLPNTRVKFRSALLGGIVAGTLWHLLQFLHVKFQIGIANYNKVYAGFAAFPLFLIWLYFSWVIVLLGGLIAWAHQSEPSFRPSIPGGLGSQAFRGLVALRSALRVVRAFVRGEPAPTSAELARELDVEIGIADSVLLQLEQAGVVAAVQDARGNVFLPAADPERLTVKRVLDSLQGKTAASELPPKTRGDLELDRLLARLDEEQAGSAYNKNLRELVQESERDAAREVSASGAPEPRTI